MVPVLMNMRTTITGRREKTDLGIFRPGEGDLEAARTGRRQVYFAGDWHETPIYTRDRLPSGAEIIGPAIVSRRIPPLCSIPAQPRGWTRSATSSSRSTRHDHQPGEQIDAQQEQCAGRFGP